MPVDPPSIRARNKYHNGTLGMATMHKSNGKTGTPTLKSHTTVCLDYKEQQACKWIRKVRNMYTSWKVAPTAHNMSTWPRWERQGLDAVHMHERDKKHHLRTWKLMVIDVVIWPATLVPVVFPKNLFRREFVRIGNILVGNHLGVQTRTKGPPARTFSPKMAKMYFAQNG